MISNLGVVEWAENPRGFGAFNALVLIATEVGSPEATDVRLADIDNDGDLDLLTSERLDLFVVAWHENLGDAEFAESVQVAEGGVVNRRYAIGDVDGDVDIVVSPWEWFESDLIDAPDSLRGDVDSNGEVNFQDFLILANNFGRDENVGREDGDLDEDGVVTFLDFLVLANNFGSRSK